jgi:hypothetical protein
MIIRVGLPHRGGKLAFHAFHRSYAAMVSANAFWNGIQFCPPDASDIQELDCALDSAGYTAMQLWKAKGRQAGIGGIFPWTYEQYIEFALTFAPTWWAQPDLCCEPEIARDQSQVDYRVAATATFLEGTLRIVDQWSGEYGQPLLAPIPVIQGWSIRDYSRSLELMLKVWTRWHASPPALIGVGSVCRRELHHASHGLLAVASAIEVHLPKGSRLHLFGVKGTALSALKMFDCIASVDSMAYDFAARMNARKAAMSNTLAHRSREMTRWMNAANSRLRPSPGDQLRDCSGGASRKRSRSRPDRRDGNGPGRGDGSIQGAQRRLCREFGK